MEFTRGVADPVGKAEERSPSGTAFRGLFVTVTCSHPGVMKA